MMMSSVAQSVSAQARLSRETLNSADNGDKMKITPKRVVLLVTIVVILCTVYLLLRGRSTPWSVSDHSGHSLLKDVQDAARINAPSVNQDSVPGDRAWPPYVLQSNISHLQEADVWKDNKQANVAVHSGNDQQDQVFQALKNRLQQQQRVIEQQGKIVHKLSSNLLQQRQQHLQALQQQLRQKHLIQQELQHLQESKPQERKPLPVGEWNRAGQLSDTFRKDHEQSRGNDYREKQANVDKSVNNQHDQFMRNQLQQHTIEQQETNLQRLSAKLHQQYQQLQQQQQPKPQESQPLPIPDWSAGKLSDTFRNDHEQSQRNINMLKSKDTNNVSKAPLQQQPVSRPAGSNVHSGEEHRGFSTQDSLQQKQLKDAASMFENAAQRARKRYNEQQVQKVIVLDDDVKRPSASESPAAEKKVVVDAAKMFEEAGQKARERMRAKERELMNKNRYLAHGKGFGNKVKPWHAGKGFQHRRLSANIRNSREVHSDRLKEEWDSLSNLFMKKESEVRMNNDHIGNKIVHAAGNRPAHVTAFDLSKSAVGDFHCVPVTYGANLSSSQVCIHSHQADSMSRQILQKGRWEAEELAQFQEALDTDSTLGALDLGAGIGLYSLVAASQHRQVVAVEPLEANYRLLHKSAQLNGVTGRMTLVTNALGDEVGLGRLQYPHPFGNMGIVYVRRLRETEVVADDTDIVDIVRLDDLIPFMRFTSAVVKLDVQGDENHVLRGAERFFTQIHVPYVLTHWYYSQNPDIYGEAGAILKRYGFRPSPSVRAKEEYTESQLNSDINFIVWKKI